jgi:hypothetical protein
MNSRVERHHLNGYQLNSIEINRDCWPLDSDSLSKYAFSSESRSFAYQSCAGLSVGLKRELSFYVLAVYFPSACFVQMALCNFLMPVAALNARLLCIFLPLACLTLLYGTLPTGTGYTLVHAWLLLCQVFVLLCFPYLALAALERAEQLVLQHSHKKNDRALERTASGQVIALPGSLNVAQGKPTRHTRKPVEDAVLPTQKEPEMGETKQSDTNGGFRWRISQPFWSFFSRSPSHRPNLSAPQAQSQPSIEQIRWQKEAEIVSFSTLKIDRQARFVMPALFYCCVMIYALYVYILHDKSNESVGH